MIAIDGDKIPSAYCIHVNSHALGRFAVLSQEAGLVPIVEPEVLMDGSHTLERCYEVTEATLEAVFNELFSQRVVYEGMLLKPNMVVSGKEAPQQATPDEVARATIRCFRGVVPAAVPGIVFLSGGQGDEEATANLNAMNAIGPHPWGSCRSPTAVPCRRRRSRPGRGTTRTSRPARKHLPTARA